MERFAWKARLLPGMKREYIRRHDEIWPEMTRLLNDAGIHNYTIWCVGDELFGYYEADLGVAFAAKAQAGSPVVDRWNEYMKDVMVMEIDPATGTAYQLEPVFFHP
jgi:L-rhamnose mutarotase